ncbi:flagellar hook-length control protein [Candidatus Photodesmus katoptron]|uniref:Flagellar hook-length control protein n=1 Tax=Candidatus Photodesmus katoptron Akat1 TaxID=1236703 RepID=S3DJM1_9GAMM|nr:flagellar hook-length control protein FliK [Candidatus Photodesmus katoptron]EPE37905.1 flagellar hook-length control protein [Candidatus Photodesmus katoptron Akat1]KEY90374.1 flagellar hook-length control protein [Candidatus Photodesmus katoptron]
MHVHLPLVSETSKSDETTNKINDTILESKEKSFFLTELISLINKQMKEKANKKNVEHALVQKKIINLDNFNNILQSEDEKSNNMYKSDENENLIFSILFTQIKSEGSMEDMKNQDSRTLLDPENLFKFISDSDFKQKYILEEQIGKKTLSNIQETSINDKSNHKMRISQATAEPSENFLLKKELQNLTISSEKINNKTTDKSLNTYDHLLKIIKNTHKINQNIANQQNQIIESREAFQKHNHLQMLILYKNKVKTLPIILTMPTSCKKQKHQQLLNTTIQTKHESYNPIIIPKTKTDISEEINQSLFTISNSQQIINNSKIHTESLSQTNHCNSLPNSAVAFSKPILVEQVAEHIQIMILKNLKNIDIRLDSPEFGKLKIHMNMNNDNSTSIHFSVLNQQIKEMIEQSIPRLRDILAEQGIHLDNTFIQQQSLGEKQSSYSSIFRKKSKKSTKNEDDINLKLNLISQKSKSNGISCYA